MRIVFIRHADPDYVNDSLTKRGLLEASLLSKRLKREYPKVAAIYVSTMGRAVETYQISASFYKGKPIYLDWLREFKGTLRRPDRPEIKSICWDFLPQDLNDLPKLFDPYHWQECQIIQDSDVYSSYQEVISAFDELLAKHGYLREKNSYRVMRSNHDVIMFFCHFGVASVMMSRLMNVSPFSLLQNTVLLPSSLSEFVSEERREGIAQFRADQISSISHLLNKGLEPSFAARFCECFLDDSRHD